VTTKKVQTSRREFVKRAAYLPPAILTLAVTPSYAKAGSQKEERVGELWDWLEDLLERWRDRR
jgi:hypothetical protein